MRAGDVAIYYFFADDSGPWRLHDAVVEETPELHITDSWRRLFD